MLIFFTDVIWVILSVEVGGLLGVTQQLSSFETEFNTQPQRNVRGDFNPFASPQKNKHDATDNSFRDPSGAWDRTQEPIPQDQNGLSHNAVNRASNGLQTNLSVVTYGQVCINQIFHTSQTTTFIRSALLSSLSHLLYMCMFKNQFSWSLSNDSIYSIWWSSAQFSTYVPLVLQVKYFFKGSP